MKGFLCLVSIFYIIQSISAEDVRLLDLDPPEAQQHIESHDQSLHYAPKIESNVPAIRYLGNEPHNVLEDIYNARQYHGQDGLGGYLYGYNIPDIAKTEKKVAGGDLRGAYNYISNDGQEIKVQYWDDGTGFHQIDNLPTILPKQVDDAPDVKAAKEEFFKRWNEEAIRNQNPVASPYDANGNSINGVPPGQAEIQLQHSGGSLSTYQSPGNIGSNQYQGIQQYQQPGQPQQYHATKQQTAYSSVYPHQANQPSKPDYNGEYSIKQNTYAYPGQIPTNTQQSGLPDYVPANNQNSYAGSKQSSSANTDYPGVENSGGFNSNSALLSSGPDKQQNIPAYSNPNSLDTTAASQHSHQEQSYPVSYTDGNAGVQGTSNFGTDYNRGSSSNPTLLASNSDQQPNIYGSSIKNTPAATTVQQFKNPSYSNPYPEQYGASTLGSGYNGGQQPNIYANTNENSPVSVASDGNNQQHQFPISGYSDTYPGHDTSKFGGQQSNIYADSTLNIPVTATTNLKHYQQPSYSGNPINVGGASDYSGGYSGNPPLIGANQNQQPNVYSGHEDSYSKSNDIDTEGQYSERYEKYDENSEENGPPKGFFYSFHYPVGKIVQKGDIARKEDLGATAYNQNKQANEAQVPGGPSGHTVPNTYAHTGR